MSGHSGIAERICSALGLLQSEQAVVTKEEKKRMEAVLYALAIKFLNHEELRKVKERIRMTLLGQMLREDGLEEGRKEGQLFNLVTLVKKKWEKGQSPSQIAEDLMEEPEKVEEIVHLLSDHSGTDVNEIFELFKNVK